MTTTLKSMIVGDETVIALPREVLERLNLNVGDRVRLSELDEESAADEATRRHEEEHEETMRVARRVMRENYDVLRRLAE